MKVMREKEKRMKEMHRDGQGMGSREERKKGRREGGRKEKEKNKGGRKVNWNRVEVRKNKGFGARKSNHWKIFQMFGHSVRVV